VWPQYWDLQEPRGLEQRDLRNLNLGDLKKGPNGGLSPTPQKKNLVSRYSDCLRVGRPGFNSRQGYDFSIFYSVQTGSEAHSASYPMGRGGLSPGGKAAGA
jgi:hypothetical protein